MISLLPGVGRRIYVVARPQLMPYPMTSSARGIRVGCLAGSLRFQCQGAKSLVYDLCTGQGVVSSRAASILRSIETLPLIGSVCFVPSIFNMDMFGGSLDMCDFPVHDMRCWPRTCCCLLQCWAIHSSVRVLFADRGLVEAWCGMRVCA